MMHKRRRKYTTIAFLDHSGKVCEPERIPVDIKLSNKIRIFHVIPAFGEPEIACVEIKIANLPDWTFRATAYHDCIKGVKFGLTGYKNYNEILSDIMVTIRPPTAKSMRIKRTEEMSSQDFEQALHDTLLRTLTAIAAKAVQCDRKIASEYKK